MGYDKGTYFFKDLGDGFDWFYCIMLETGAPNPKIKVKYIIEKLGAFGEQARYGESYIHNLKRTPEGRYVGSFDMRDRKAEPRTGSIAFRSMRKGILSIMDRSGVWKDSKEFRAAPPPVSVKSGGTTLSACCVASLQKMNTMIDAQYDLDFISLVGDAAAIVDSANGMAQALNSAMQKAGTYNASSPSVMMSTTVRNNIQRIAMEEQNQHTGKQKMFWEAVEKAWGK